MQPTENSAEQITMRDLFTGTRTMPTILLGAGVGIEALEFYITASLTPSVVRDIGGLELLAWTTSLFVAAVVLGSIFVVIRPLSISLNMSYVGGALLFGLGSAIIAMAPDMTLVLVGRFVQGFGAGILVTMAYAFIRFVYPPGLQNAASAFYSSLWGIAVFLGPTVGGMFSSGSNWRIAFWILVPFAILMALAAPRFLPKGEDGREKASIPLIQIFLMLAAILFVSFASTAETDFMRILLVSAGLIGIVLLLVQERRSSARLLPAAATHLGHPLTMTYLIMFLLMVVISSDIFIPYFLQTLHATTPLVAGYIVALVALGWTAASLATTSLQGRRALVSILSGSLVTTASALILGLLVGRDNADGNLVVLGLISALLFGLGMGIGLAWAHLVTIIITRAEPVESDKATAAINMVQSLGAAFGSAICGVLANSAGLVTPGGTTGAISAGFWLYTLIALPGILCLFVAYRLLRSEAAT